MVPEIIEGMGEGGGVEPLKGKNSLAGIGLNRTKKPRKH